MTVKIPLENLKIPSFDRVVPHWVKPWRRHGGSDEKTEHQDRRMEGTDKWDENNQNHAPEHHRPH